ncbi:ATP-binding cassette domain-containing protein [Streptomyces atratus]
MIEARGLRKTFRSRKVSVPAVRDLDLDVAEGEIFGLLGPNGAGKPTLMRMPTTLLPPDGGEATVAGADLRRHPRRVRRRIGYVAQGPATWRLVTAYEELVIQGRLHGMSRAAAKRRAAEVVDALGTADSAHRQCGSYSDGQRRRVDIALGLVHEPALRGALRAAPGLRVQSGAARGGRLPGAVRRHLQRPLGGPGTGDRGRRRGSVGRLGHPSFHPQHPLIRSR